MGRQSYINDEEDTPISVDDFLPHHVQSKYTHTRTRAHCGPLLTLSVTK